MIIWFFLALGAALTNSWVQALSKWGVFVSRYSKMTIGFVAMLTASLILFGTSFFIIGAPELGDQFWLALAITGIMNIIAFPILLKAYEEGEFSSVYSMILLTPVFLLLTSFIFLGEVPSLGGVFGVIVTVVGLWIITKSAHRHTAVPNYFKGNMFGIVVALLWSVSINFDKIATLQSDPFFAPATITGVMALAYLGYLLVMHKKVLVHDARDAHDDAVTRRLHLSPLIIFLTLGVVMAFSNVLHNSALIVGLASYTIAVKRTGILFGIIWGWLFFKERQIARKTFGALVAIAGVVLILFS